MTTGAAVRVAQCGSTMWQLSELIEEFSFLGTFTIAARLVYNLGLLDANAICIANPKSSGTPLFK